jgi:hypothetical protein
MAVAAAAAAVVALTARDLRAFLSWAATTGAAHPVKAETGK